MPAGVFNDLYLDEAEISSGKLTPPYLESKKVLVADGKLEDWTGPVTKVFSPIMKKSQKQPAAHSTLYHVTALHSMHARATFHAARASR